MVSRSVCQIRVCKYWRTWLNSGKNPSYITEVDLCTANTTRIIELDKWLANQVLTQGSRLPIGSFKKPGNSRLCMRWAEALHKASFRSEGTAICIREKTARTGDTFDKCCGFLWNRMNRKWIVDTTVKKDYVIGTKGHHFVNLRGKTTAKTVIPFKMPLPLFHCNFTIS